MKNFLVSISKYFILIALILVGIGLVTGSIQAVIITGLLILLEFGLSFDNAVVNVKVLEKMPAIWQRRFMTWGILLAVFGVRLFFPIVMVVVTTALSFEQVFHLALYEPHLYAQALHDCFPMIAAFGGGFLLMVAAEFFLIPAFSLYWIKPLEQGFEFFSRLPGHLCWFIALALLVFYGMGYEWVICEAFALGLIGQYLLHQLNHYLNSKMVSGMKAGFSGLIGFFYLELLDASFSFDGVLGAFALTDSLVIIMIGLGLGALLVRSLTLYFLRYRIMAQLPYLDHGAHYAILSLALMLIVKISADPPEWLVGSLSFGVLGLSVLFSLQFNKR